MSRYLSLRINSKVGERMSAHAKALQWSSNQFAEKAIESVCDIIENPETRSLPDFVAMLDALRLYRKRPLPLDGTERSE